MAPRYGNDVPRVLFTLNGDIEVGVGTDRRSQHIERRRPVGDDAIQTCTGSTRRTPVHNRMVERTSCDEHI